MFLRDIQRKLFGGTPPRPAPRPSKIDFYAGVLCRVLSWQDPSLSCLTLAGLHLLLWLIVALDLRFYAVVFLAILVLFVCDIYYDKLSLESATCEMAPVPPTAFVCASLAHLRNMREENRTVFCVTMCGIFLALTFISRAISGSILTYLLMLATFAGPLVVSKLPPEVRAQFTQAINVISDNDETLAESELIPFISEKDFDRNDADLESLISEKTVDSVTNSLISGITSMPSHLDADDSMDGLDEDLDFRGAAISYTPDDISTSDSDSDHQMRFQSTHFNGSGSSSDSSKPNLMQSAGSILTSGRQIISDALAKASSSHPRLPARTGGTDSDGSEFEIIDEGDLEKP